MSRTYWLDLFTVETWQEFREHGGTVTGFTERRLATVKKMQPGDYLLYYLTRASRWVGLLEVTGEGYYDTTTIWASQVFPSRIPVRVLLALDPEYGVPVLDMRDELSIFQNLTNPNRWNGPFRGSPARWKPSDGDAIVRALREAEAHPVHRPLGNLKPAVKKAPSVVVDAETDTAVTVPQDDETTELNVHTEIQYRLLKLGADMGLSVYVAKNDQSKQWQGKTFSELPRRRASLPQQFDPATTKIIEMIDVLWLSGNAIAAAFEVESTTSIYSGLLRMSDLVAMQPNLSIPLFLVAPDERRDRVMQQVNRPTFSIAVKPPLNEICRYISFDVLREELDKIAGVVKYMNPAWLQEVSESCELGPD